MDWRHRAACLTEDPELFFPVGNTGPALQQIEDAKKICQSCTVKDQCLNWALDAGQDHGVWGGMSEDERRAMKRRAARSRERGSRRSDFHRKDAERTYPSPQQVMKLPRGPFLSMKS